MIKLVSIFLAALTSFEAKATVVYIDINNNPQERAAYTAALAQAGHGESFISIPQVDPMSSTVLSQMARKRDGIWVRYVEAGCKQDLTCGPVQAGQCTDIQTRLHAQEAAIAKIPKTNLTAESLRAGLKQISTTPNEPVTLAISGHFGGGVFTGNLGSMSVQDMASVFSEFPQLRSQIVRLHLLGCYTNVYSQVTSLWRVAFPRARVLAGFYERSPAGSDPRNLAFIKYLVKQAPSFDQIRTESQFERMMHSFDQFHGIHTALCVDDFYEEAGGKILDVDEMFIPVKKCVARLPQADLDYFQKVFRGDAAMPSNTDSSRIRSYYSALRDNAVCLDEPEFKKIQGEVPTPDLAMRLLFYRNIVINFRHLYSQQVTAFDQSLAALGIERGLWLQNTDLTNRRATLAWRAALQQKLGVVADQESANVVMNELKGYSDTLVELKPECVPVNWVEPSGFESSACLSKVRAGVCQ